MSSEVKEEDKTDGPSPGIFIAPYRCTMSLGMLCD